MASDDRNNCRTNDYDGNKAKFKVGAIGASNLKTIRKRNINKMIKGQQNINPPRNKF